MGYAKRKMPSAVLKRILTNCDKLKNSIDNLGVNKTTELLGGSLKKVYLKSETELELTCRRTFDKVDVVIRIEAVVDKNGKVSLIIKEKN